MKEGLDRINIDLPFSVKKEFKLICMLKDTNVRKQVTELLKEFNEKNKHLLPKGESTNEQPISSNDIREIVHDVHVKEILKQQDENIPHNFKDKNNE